MKSVHRQKPKGAYAKDSRSLQIVPKVSEFVVTVPDSNGRVNIVHFHVNDFFFSLDGASAEFWLLINGKRSFSKIIDKLAARHNYDQKLLHRHFRKLVKHLASEGLITI